MDTGELRARLYEEPFTSPMCRICQESDFETPTHLLLDCLGDLELTSARRRLAFHLNKEIPNDRRDIPFSKKREDLTIEDMIGDLPREKYSKSTIQGRHEALTMILERIFVLLKN